MSLTDCERIDLLPDCEVCGNRGEVTVVVYETAIVIPCPSCPRGDDA